MSQGNDKTSFKFDKIPRSTAQKSKVTGELRSYNIPKFTPATKSFESKQPEMRTFQSYDFTANMLTLIIRWRLGNRGRAQPKA